MQIMREIREDFLKQRGEIAGNNRETAATARSAMPLNAGRVLLIARDELAASQLRDCLIHGTNYVMDVRYRWFVSQQCAEVRRKSHRSSRSSAGSSGSSRTGRPGAPASAATAAAPPGYTSGPNQDKDAAQELFSERNVSGLLQQGGDAAAAAPDEADDAKGGFCDLGLSEVDVKRLPVETQMLLLQERVLKLSPPVTSQRHGGWSLRQTATAADDDDDVAAVSGVKRESMSTEEAAVKRRKLADEAAAVPLEHVDNVIDLADIDDDDGGGGSGALAADRSMDDDGSNDDDNGPRASASAKKGRASLGPSTGSKTPAGRGAGRPAAAKSSDRKRPAVEAAERSDDVELIDVDVDNDGTRTRRPPQAARFVDISDELIVHVTTHHQLRESWSLLRDVQPATIVLYDADVRIIRQIEAYQSSMAVTQPPVRVYFLAYGKRSLLWSPCIIAAVCSRPLCRCRRGQRGGASVRGGVGERENRLRVVDHDEGTPRGVPARQPVRHTGGAAGGRVVDDGLESPGAPPRRRLLDVGLGDVRAAHRHIDGGLHDASSATEQAQENRRRRPRVPLNVAVAAAHHAAVAGRAADALHRRLRVSA